MIGDEPLSNENSLLHSTEQAARYADPATRCLFTRSDDHRDPLELDRLGPFTCVADSGFLLRALSVALNIPTLLVMDVGPRIHTDSQLLMPQEMEVSKL